VFYLTILSVAQIM